MAEVEQTSPLLALPMELRLNILELLIPQSSTAARIAWSSKYEHPFPAQPAISRTCRRMREDCLPIFYAQTHFTLHVPQQEEHAQPSKPYLEHFTLTPGFRSLQTICITTGSEPHGLAQRPTMEFAFNLKRAELRMKSWGGKGDRKEYQSLCRQVDERLGMHRAHGRQDRLGLLRELIGLMERSSVEFQRQERALIAN